MKKIGELLKENGVGSNNNLKDVFVSYKKVEKRFLNEINNIIYNTFPFNFIGLIVASSLIYFLVPYLFGIKEELSHDVLPKVWYGSMLIIITFRLVLYFWYKKTYTKTSLVAMHYYSYIVAAALTTLVWGLVLVFFDSNQIALQIFLILTIYAVIGAELQSLGESYLGMVFCVLSGLIPPLVFTVIQIFSNSQPLIYIGLFITLLIYSVYLISSGYKIYKSLMQNLMLKGEKYNLTKDLEFSTTHDFLTGLITRKGLEERLQQVIPSARLKTSTTLVVLYINFDGFRNINDTHGLYMGDVMIQAIVKRMKESIRDSDWLARIEGDEFVIVLNDHIKDANQISRTTDKINKKINEPYEIEAKNMKISASIGISVFPEDGEDEKILLSNAHIAMHAAKEKGGNNFQFFTQKLKGEILENFSLENQIKNGLINNEFYLEYQPKISLKTGSIMGLEALLRWNNPIYSNLSPAEYISLSEKRGLIVPLTMRVLHLMCEQMLIWKNSTVTVYRAAINLSSFVFEEGSLIEMFSETFKKYNLNPELFEIEITESAFLQNLERNLDFLQQFKNMGVKISLDDFGTGYSSLSYLRFLEVDSLKIDRSFIKELPKDEKASVLVKAIIAVAHSLKINVIAEGVENKAQLDFLKRQGCDEIQGYYITVPLKGKKITDFIIDYKGIK